MYEWLMPCLPVHVHVIPRRLNDYPRNDLIYDELDNLQLKKSYMIDDEHRRPRTQEEMSDEAATLSAFFIST